MQENYGGPQNKSEFGPGSGKRLDYEHRETTTTTETTSTGASGGQEEGAESPKGGDGDGDADADPASVTTDRDAALQAVARQADAYPGAEHVITA